MEKRVVAIHECSHALVCHLYDPRRVPVKVCINDDNTGKLTVCSVRTDVELTASNIVGRIAAQLAGKIGEELVFGKEHGGSEADLYAACKDAEEFGVDLGDGAALALNALTRNRDLLEGMAQALVEKGIIRDKDLEDWVKQSVKD